jgi:serine phosphatase RsbU (regulator of sigma subunit)/anti-sigma regulatory factor (Ser/Thr protein kinase)
MKISLNYLIHQLEDSVFSKQEIMKILHEGLQKTFNLSSINIYFLDPISNNTEETYPIKPTWNLPSKEKQWILEHSKKTLISQKEKKEYCHYVKTRHRLEQTDKVQLRKDEQSYNYSCDDYLAIPLSSDESIILGIVIIHQWNAKKHLFSSASSYQSTKNIINPFIEATCLALDNLHIHKKIESLLSDKHQLKMRLQKDEEDLKRRVLELTSLYDTSTSLGNALNYHQIINLVTDALVKTLEFDLCSIFLKDFIPNGEIISRINVPLTKDSISTSQENLLNAIKPFIKETFAYENIKTTLNKNYTSANRGKNHQTMRSFANVPLIFKEEVIGMINLCSKNQNAFPKSEMPFIHTMANQLASNLGRLKIVRDLEHSKINSLIECMDDGVIFIDEHNQLKIINPTASTIFNGKFNFNTPKDTVAPILESFGFLTVYTSVFKSKKPRLNKKFSIHNRSYSVNISPVLNEEVGFMGTVIVLRDITEIEKIDRVKTQRLEVISKVNLILKSITDLGNLLTVLMEFILNVAHAEMGSIQLKQDEVFFSKIHSNFPDKIRRFYKFTNGITISEQVIKQKEIYYIDDYKNNSNLMQNVKIFIDSYLCIPIMVKNELIGIVNIARKSGNPNETLTEDDILTLSTITTLSGTAIQNAILFQETMSRQKLDQELKIATQIQSKLLPEVLPELKNVLFGAISVPAREIGGDYYDFFNLENGDIGIVVADIVGKGIPAGLFMAMLKSIMHTHFSSHSSPRDALAKVNEVLLKDPVINKFVPVFYAVLNPKELTLKYCNAGHEPALLFSNNDSISLETDGFPLGAIEDPGYEEKEIKLSHNDIVMILTDGAIDARLENGESFGYPKLKDLILTHSNQHPQFIVDELLTEIKTESQHQDQHDDITLVALKIVENYDHTNKQPSSIKELTVTSSKENVKLIRGMVEKICKSIGFSDENTFYLKLAINEAQANVIEHAYFGSDKGEIYFKFMIYQDRLEIVIKDFGPGIDQRTIKGDKEHLSELEGSGLGVFLINNIMDEIIYNRKENGTELFLSKRLSKEENKKWK